MKKMLLLATVLFAFSAVSALAADTMYVKGSGGAWWEGGNWVYCPIWSEDTCAIIITDDWGNKTSGIFGWPGGSRTGRRYTYCPNPGKEICAIVIEGPNPGDPSTHAFYGKGGARRYNNGDWVYCPIPANQICAIVQIGPPGGPITTNIYGAGGVYQHPDYTEYCPLDGEELCYVHTELPYPPKDTGRDVGQQKLIEQSMQPSATPGNINSVREMINDAAKVPGTEPRKTDLD